MNAAFLLVTAAWLAGADPAPTAKPTPAAPTAPVVAAPGGSCCGGGCGATCGSCCDTCCDTCCDCCCKKPSLMDRLRARKCKCCTSCCDCCDSCCNTCCAPTCCNTCCAPTCCNTCDGCCDCCCCKKPSLMDRLRARKCKCCCTPCCDTCCDGCGGCGGCGSVGGCGAPAIHGQPMPPAGEPIKLPKDATPGDKLPKGTPGKTQASPSTLEVTPTSSSAIETGTKNPFELDRRYETRVDRAADYSWLTGQLFYVHADGGLWVLRYAPLAKEDPHGGSVILARDRQMDSYREGDLVTVRGEIIKPKGSIFLGGPLYQTQSIQLIDRAQR